MTDPTPPPTPGTAVAIDPHRAAGALAIQSDQQEFTPAQRSALAQIGLADAPEGDLLTFLTYAQRTQLDPWARQLYMIARWDGRERRNKYTIQASIDGLRIVAQRTGDYAGQVGPEWCGPDGKWRDVWLLPEAPAAARVGVLRKGWAAPQFAVAIFREYAGTNKEGQPTAMWRDKPALMIAKCAEALALRKAFPHDLSGVYTADEMSRADVVHGEVVPDQRQHHVEQAPQQPPGPPPEPFDADELRGIVLSVPSLASLRLGLIGLGAITVVDGRDSWANARLDATRTAMADGQETDGLTLVRTVAATLPASDPDPTPPADDVVDGELVPDASQEPPW